MTRTIFTLAIAATFGLAAPVVAAQPAPVAADSAAGQRAMANPDVVTVRNVNRIELTQGLAIVDDDGQPVGTVDRFSGNNVILTDGKAQYLVPFTKIYAYNRDGADYFASRIPRSKLKPMKRSRRR